MEFEAIFGLLLCMFGWALLIGLPILISIWMNRSQQRRNFLQNVRYLNGTVVSQNSESVIVTVPFGSQVVSGAYFPGSDHWFGRETLELHFALPETAAQFFMCCPCSHARRLPAGWIRIESLRSGRMINGVVATSTPSTAIPILDLGVIGVFDQLQRIRSASQSRIAVDNHLLMITTSHFANTASELAKVLSLGTQMAQQIGLFADGSVTLSEAFESEDSQKACPICSSPVINPVRCQRCQTSHCAECWEYNHRICGVFACNGNQASPVP